MSENTLERRAFAFIRNSDVDISIVKADILIAAKPEFNADIYVFTDNDNAEFNDIQGVTMVRVPDDKLSTAKKWNFINQHMKSLGTTRFLHVFESTTKIDDSLALFAPRIEHAMDVLDYPVWLNTKCDGCNYVYHKYNPRLSVPMNYDKFKGLDLPESILFTSHSNLAYSVFDLKNASDEQLRFEEKFNALMYTIIEFLARRRNQKTPGSLFYMNMYMSIDNEYGFKTADVKVKGDTQDDLREDDKVFKSMQVNYIPDNNIDIVVEDLYKKLLSKAA